MVKIVVSVFVATAVIAALVAAGALVITTDNNRAACEANNDIRIVLTKVLTRSQTLAPKNTDFTPAEKEVALEFYTKALNELKPHSC